MTFPSVEWHRNGYTLSTDPARLDIGTILRFLAEESYWAQGLTLPRLERAIAGSLPLGIYAPDGALAGFARVVTDWTVFAYLRDVFVLPAHRGKGLASWLAEAVREHPELSGVTTWMLATADAHAVYARAGYSAVPHPEWYMSVRQT